jgi:hypothetical protein
MTEEVDIIALEEQRHKSDAFKSGWLFAALMALALAAMIVAIGVRSCGHNAAPPPATLAIVGLPHTIAPRTLYMGHLASSVRVDGFRIEYSDNIDVRLTGSHLRVVYDSKGPAWLKVWSVVKGHEVAYASWNGWSG